MNRYLQAIAIAIILLILAGCSSAGQYLGFWKKERQLKKQFQNEPAANLLREIQPESSYMLLGPVRVDSSYAGPLLVIAVTDKFQKREIVAQRVLQSPVLYYQAYLPEGDYDLYFFADLNGDGWFNPDEMVGQTSGAPVQVRKEKVKGDMTFAGPVFTLDLKNPGKTDLPVKVQARQQDYVINSIDDDFFDPKWGEIGFYDARVLFTHTQRFIFSLEKFDPGKTAVFFVHGVAGTPRDFKYIVDGLDRKRYQPWFYFYPSGAPLQKLGSFFADVLRIFEKDFQSRRAIVVAHSMGGLVALSALNEFSRDGSGYVKGYISFNSPYGGVESAAKALESAPVVVACWRDVAPDSLFLKNLYKGSAAAKIPFHLFFGYENGKSSDGTITLQSQLEHRVQFTADKIYGFNAEHVGILNNSSALKKFQLLLDQIDGPRAGK